MGLFDRIRRPEAQSRPFAPPVERIEPALAEVGGSRPMASAGQQFAGLDDPALLEFMRNGAGPESGAYMSGMRALRNMAVLRSTTLISESIGMLPLNLIEKGREKRHAVELAAYRLLKVKPNNWQTPYEFKSQVQLAALIHGNGYARVIWSLGRPIALVPMDSKSVTPKLTDAWEMVYQYTRKDGGMVTLPAKEVFHLRDLSEDGVSGMSRVKLASEAIGLAVQAERAAARLFKSGVMAGGAIEVPNELSDTAYDRMRNSIAERHSGVENAGSWMILEENAKASKWANNAVDAQHIENRNHQIEEVARAFGIPRPLLMMDDTSWGSGIEQLGIFFVQYGLQHWFTAWEQAVERTLLADADIGRVSAKFNERALLRGTLKDQADFFSKALGTGGQAPWMSQNEVRDLQDMPASSSPDTDELRPPLAQQKKPDEPTKTA